VRAQAGTAIGQATGCQRGGMKCVNVTRGFRPKTNMRAAAATDLSHIGAEIDPELGIALAETDRGRPRYQTRKSERRQGLLIKARGSFEVTNGDGYMVDHDNFFGAFPSFSKLSRGARQAGAPDLTSL
jgi:hypothetical protein